MSGNFRPDFSRYTYQQVRDLPLVPGSEAYSWREIYAAATEHLMDSNQTEAAAWATTTEMLAPYRYLVEASRRLATLQAQSALAGYLRDADSYWSQYEAPASDSPGNDQAQTESTSTSPTGPNGRSGTVVAVYRVTPRPRTGARTGTTGTNRWR